MNPEVTRNKVEEGCGKYCLGYEMNILHAISRDCSEPAGPLLRFLLAGSCTDLEDVVFSSKWC